MIDWAEAGLDSLLHGNVLRDIPVLRGIIGVRDAHMAFREALYTRKLLAFLSPIAQLPQPERDRLVTSIADSPQEQQDAGERLLILIDRLDSRQKARFAGRALVAFGRGHCDRSTLDRILYAIERVLPDDLRHLPAYIKTKQVPSDVLYGLANAGLARIGDGLITSRYYPNEPVCKTLVEHILPPDIVG